MHGVMGTPVAKHWDEVRDRLKGELGDTIFQSWFARMEVTSVRGSTIHLSVPTRFLRKWIDTHYAGHLLRAWRAADPSVAQVSLEQRTPVLADKRTPESASMQHLGDIPRDVTVRAGGERPTAIHSDVLSSPIDPGLTFAAFVASPANSIVTAAARQAAIGQPGFNPIYLHAPVGTGKTHLLHAITNEASLINRRALYLSAERLVHRAVARGSIGEFVDAIATGHDVISIDDIHFLSGRLAQEGLRLLVELATQCGKQVVLACAYSPADVDRLDDRLRSRISGGLVLEIVRPDEATRRGILYRRIETISLRHPGFRVSDSIVALLAARLGFDVRELLGALNRMLVWHTGSGGTPTLELAAGIVAAIDSRQGEPQRPTIEQIQRAVAACYQVSRQDMMSSRRTANVVLPRQIAMYLAKVLTLKSLPEIGRRFGGRDHTTVLHAVRKLDRLVGEDQHLASEIEAIKSALAERR